MNEIHITQTDISPVNPVKRPEWPQGDKKSERRQPDKKKQQRKKPEQPDKGNKDSSHIDRYI